MRNGWFWIHLTAFIAFSFFTFHRNLGYLYWGGDGAYALHVVSHQSKWLPLWIGLSADYLQGLGDMFFQNNTRLDPGYVLPLLLFGPDVTTLAYQLTSYTLFSVELFICTFILARALSIKFIPSILSAWLAPLLIMPYFGHAVLYPITSMSPHHVTTLCVNLLLFAAIAQLGQKHNALASAYFDYLLTIAIILLVVWLCIIYPAGCLLWVPAAIIGTIGLLAGSADKREFIIKLCSLLVVCVICTISGLLPFIYGILSYSVAYLLPNQVIVTNMSWSYVSCWYFSPVGHYLIMLCAGGMALAIIGSHRHLRYFAIASIFFMAMIFGVGAAAMHVRVWHGPFPIYFEGQFWAIYAIFASYLIISLLTPFGKMINYFLPEKAAYMVQPLLVATCLMTSLTISLLTPTINRPSPLPSVNEPMVSLLQKKIGLTAGMPYRGRVATLLLSTRAEPIGWPELIAINQPHLEKYSNDFYWAGLWFAGIPTLFEYSQSMSPAFFYVTRKLVGRDDDLQSRNVIVLRRPDYHNLTILGVSYVISDSKLRVPFKLVMEDKLAQNDVLYLYHLPDANIGAFSPSRLIAASSLDDAISIMANKEFNPRTTAVTDPDVSGMKLIQAKNISLQILRGKLHISAESSGLSLVALPFEYSHCLTITSMQSSAKLLRINAIQTGVLFSGSLQADIAYQYSPLKNAMCRIKDGRWLRAELARRDAKSAG